MPKSYPHKKWQRIAAGWGGSVEVPLPSGRRLDALSANGVWGTEVEFSGRLDRMLQAAERLDESGAPMKVLRVPQRDMRTAAAAAREVGVSLIVRNMWGTRQFWVGAGRRGSNRRGRR